VTHDASFARRFTRLVWLADGQVVDEPQFQID
jgi:predicted ABC-type transport system involved in lysophospholipase L1 biosynthesis ATPase subunit